MTDQTNILYFLQQEERAREQAADSHSITARIAHLARADEYALQIATLKGGQSENA